MLLIRIGRFTLEITSYSLFVRVPGVGQVHWYRRLGFTWDSWKEVKRELDRRQ